MRGLLPFDGLLRYVINILKKRGFDYAWFTSF